MAAGKRHQRRAEVAGQHHRVGLERGDAVALGGHHQDSTAGDHRLPRQRADELQRALAGLAQRLGDLLAAQRLVLDGHVGEVAERDEEHREVEARLDRGGQRGRVAAQAHAGHADVRRAPRAQPPEQCAQIPDRLAEALDGAAGARGGEHRRQPAARRPAGVERQGEQRHVEAQAVEPHRVPRQLFEAVYAGAIAMQADDGGRGARVAQEPRLREAVLGEGQVARSAERLLGLPAALPLQIDALAAERQVAHVAGGQPARRGRGGEELFGGNGLIGARRLVQPLQPLTVRGPSAGLPSRQRLRQPHHRHVEPARCVRQD